MTYPKQIMRMSELKKMGFPEKWLLKVYRIRNNGVAWKQGKARNSPILFDTEQLEKERRMECATSEQY